MNQPLTVLSLFDGISVGLQAFKNLNIPIKAYYTSEIDETAIAVSKNNHKEKHIYRAGDIRYLNGDIYPGIDLLIGGSPCISFSCAGKRNGFKTKNYIIKDYYHYLDLKYSGVDFEGQSYLFWEYIRLKKETHPEYFFLENTYMSKKWSDIISEALNVEPVIIDSKSFSPQTRVRMYWTNIPFNLKDVPDDSGTYVKDILMKWVDPKVWIRGKSFYPIKEHRSERGLKCLGGLGKPGEKPWKRVDKDGNEYFPKMSEVTSASQFRQNQRVYSLMSKAPTLTRVNYAVYQFPKMKHRKLMPLEMERLQGLPDCYTIGFSERQRNIVLGNAWNTKTIEFFLKYFQKNVDSQN